MQPPSYFEAVRQKALDRWQQLEADPDLAGPWKHLFRQVQSPRHVLSELLQNADDAGATQASARIEAGRFIFWHDGRDFTDEDFASLCRFGFSNKRHLHTIGFRGIGFKSTFSLGPRVTVSTPTLQVEFERRRFTLPEWVEAPLNTKPVGTTVAVAIEDEGRQRDLEANLAEWLLSPDSLLFFRHMRSLTIGSDTVKWQVVGAGPVDGSTWMRLSDSERDEVLVLRSEPEPFPEEALAEIRDERLADPDEPIELPPAAVDLVLGSPGRIFVVLPTGLVPNLPFACNAPFVQDPARGGIKDLSISPTNRWLLSRVGQLAGEAMLAWLGNAELPVGQRARAYALLPDVDRNDSSAAGVCATAVELAAEAVLKGKPLALTDEGDLVGAADAVAVPAELAEVWPAPEVAAWFDKAQRPALATAVAPDDLTKLINWKLVGQIAIEQQVEVLAAQSLPRPATWQQLLRLWVYLAPHYESPQPISYWKRYAFHILPVRGSDHLHAKAEVVRLGENRTVGSAEDWEFLSRFLHVLDPGWTRFMADEAGAEADGHAAERSQAILGHLGLKDPSNANSVMAQVSARFFAAHEVPTSDAIRLAHIAARMGVATGSAFQYLTTDGLLRKTSGAIIRDASGDWAELLPPDYYARHALHGAYETPSASCPPDQWRRWAASEQSGLLSVPPLMARSRETNEKRTFEARVAEICPSVKLTYPYSTSRTYTYQKYIVVDHDFQAELLSLWGSLPEDTPIWSTLLAGMLARGPSMWKDRTLVELRQTSTGGQSEGRVRGADIPAAWVRRFRELACLPDTKGILHRPHELLRRTPQTEALVGVEPFLASDLDVEANAPLLDLLGVRTTPSGPDALLGRLRALALAPAPPVHELDRWYHRLDELVREAAPDQQQAVREAFAAEKLIFTSARAWATSASVYRLDSDEGVPGLAALRPDVANLALWTVLGVPDRPSPDMAIAWLKTLASGQRPAQDDLRRVRAMLVALSGRVWEECGHWLNLLGQWQPVRLLKYGETRREADWIQFDDWVKRQTADLRRVPDEVLRAAPFSQLPALGSLVERRFEGSGAACGPAEHPAWLRCLGRELGRVVLDDEEQTQRFRELAARLAATTWQRVSSLEMMPYLEGTPAGAAEATDAVWQGATLYVSDLPDGRLAKAVAQQLGEAFGDSAVAEAAHFCFDRSDQKIREWIEASFAMSPDSEIDEAEPPAVQPEPEPLSLEAVALVIDDPVALPDGHESTRAKPTRQTLREPVTAPAVRGPSLLERFALGKGFQPDGQGRYTLADGSLLDRDPDQRGMWQCWSADGDGNRTYWVSDHCLESGPVEMAADLWRLIQSRPAEYAVVLVNQAGQPVELRGEELVRLQEAGRLKVYPATYRLVYANDDTP